MITLAVAVVRLGLAPQAHSAECRKRVTASAEEDSAKRRRLEAGEERVATHLARKLVEQAGGESVDTKDQEDLSMKVESGATPEQGGSTASSSTSAQGVRRQTEQNQSDMGEQVQEPSTKKVRLEEVDHDDAMG